ncbi:MAG: PKD domain-containing protein, partial [Saprospiraceae bacterium]
GLSDLKILNKRTDFRTFNGTIKGQNSMVSMSIADGFFSIMIDDRKDRYFIEPLDFESLSNAMPSEQQYLMYKTSDLIPAKGILCGADLVNRAVNENLEKLKKESLARAKPCKICAEVKICLAADYPMYRKYGGSVNQTENQMLNILADVQTVYDDEFENEYQYVVTGTFIPEEQAKDPFNGMNDINAMLNRFRDIAETSMFANSQHNVATLWTSKFGPTGTVGTAFQASVCLNDRYNVCSDYWGPGGRQGDYLTLQAHMLGHNWSMIHDAGISPTIMAPGLPNGSTAWSGLAIASLNSYARTEKLIESGCLPICPNSSAPVPDFSADITYGCQPVTVKFKDLSINTTKWKWSFPGGTPDTSTQKNPVIVYKTAGTYNVTLEAGSNRCEVELTKVGFIEINDVPVADFSYGLQGREIFFIDQSLRADEYSWKFGDGEFSEESNPFHEFPTDSTFEVTLTVRNDCGVHTIKKLINVVSVPTAEFDSDTIGGCAPGIIKFFDQSTRNVKNWQWEFVGGVPSVSTQKNPVVKYNLPGVYDVRLTVYGSRFNHSITKKAYITIDSLPVAQFANSIDVGKVDFTNQSRYAKSHIWIFGDNTTSTDPNPSHNYTEGTYEVKYVAINGCGTDTAVTTLIIGVKPTASFSVGNPKGCAPYKVQFQNASVAATNYQWYFPGGSPSTSTDPNPLISYNNAGKFNVSLVASNVFYKDSIGKQDFIDVNTIPNAGFTNSIAGFKSTFTNQSTGGLNYLWDFGDGKPSFEKNPIHDYGVEGEFNVRLIVQNECGLDTFKKQVAVYLVPKVNFVVDTIKGCAPLTVNFNDKSSVDVIEWDWLFENGNPTTSKLKNPVVVFNKKGKYTVKLTVKNTNGTNALTKTQYIQVLSPVLCPEHTKTGRFNISDLPFGGGLENRSDDFEYELPIIFPNPAKDYILVYTNASRENPVSIDMFDLSGRKMTTHQSLDQVYRIQTNHIQAGTYYLKINNGKNAIVTKFVIAN